MIAKKFDVLSSCLLAAMVTLFVVAIAGCDRREEVYPVEGNAYMHDPEFRSQLDACIKERDGLAKTRFKANAELNAYIKELGGDYAAATNTPRGLELYCLVRDTEAFLVSNRVRVAKITRDRMRRAKADSERIARGEAKAIKVEKNLNKEAK